MTADTSRIEIAAHQPSPVHSVESRSGRSVRMYSLSELSEVDIDLWRSLETRALEPNIFLTYDFVCALQKHIMRDQQVLLMVVESVSSSTREFTAVMPVIRSALSRWLRLPAILSIDSKYSFLGGMLLDRTHAREAADAIFAALREHRWRYFGLRVRKIPYSTAQGQIIRNSAEQAGIYWRQDSLEKRACLRNLDDSSRDWLCGISKKRLKEMRRLNRRLEGEGELAWRLVDGAQIDESAIARFLELEDLGWKGANGSSLRSDRSRENFFRTLVNDLKSEGRVFFTELLLNGRSIASTVNFRVGSEAFAFKIGWDPDYARFSPGILNEIEFLKQIGENSAWSLRSIDSGSREGSFIDNLWSDRLTLASGILTANPVGILWCGLVTTIRSFSARLLRADTDAGTPS